MAAGQGFKTFVTGEVLTAGDVNGYLMQGINVFASTAARDAAITAPAEGQFAFTKDTNGLWYYDGAAWVASGATGDIEGVTAGVGISGGGTSGTVTITNSMATAIDAKGDLVAGTGADAFSRLAVGSNGTVLTADSAEATGLKWATPSAGTDTWTLLSTTTLSGAATRTVTGLSSSKYYVQIINASSANPYAYFFLRFNSDSGNNYPAAYYRRDFESSYSQSSTGYSDTSLTNNTIIMGRTGDSAGNNVSGFCQVTNCTSTSRKTFNVTSGVNSAGSPNAVVVTGQGFYTGTSAITSISLESSSGDFDNGTMYIYGA